MSESGSSTAPGWYYAQGDPAGTQRYWDGTQWVGSPQPAAGAAVGAYGTQTLVGGATPAQLGNRVLAFLIDLGLSFGVVVVGLIVSSILGQVNETLGAVASIVLVFGGYIGFVVWNNMIRQGRTGQTVGKGMRNIKLVGLADGQPVGVGGAIVRWLIAAALSGVTCGVGGLLDYLWPFFDQKRQRLTDKIIKYNVVQA